MCFSALPLLGRSRQTEVLHQALLSAWSQKTWAVDQKRLAQACWCWITINVHTAWHIMLPCEFAKCFAYQNVKRNRIQFSKSVHNFGTCTRMPRRNCGFCQILRPNKTHWQEQMSIFIDAEKAHTATDSLDTPNWQRHSFACSCRSRITMIHFSRIGTYILVPTQRQACICSQYYIFLKVYGAPSTFPHSFERGISISPNWWPVRCFKPRLTQPIFLVFFQVGPKELHQMAAHFHVWGSAPGKP